MGRLFALDPTQGQRYVGVLAATNPTDDDAHRTVDYYLETTTGYTAARVHDTDAGASLLATVGTKAKLHDAVLVLPLSGALVYTPWVNVSTWADIGVWVKNVGIVATTNCYWQLATDVAGVDPSAAQGGAYALGAASGLLPYDALPIAGNYATATAKRTGINGLGFRIGFTIAAGAADGAIRVVVLGLGRIWS